MSTQELVTYLERISELEKSYPVITKNTPTPPIHLCGGRAVSRNTAIQDVTAYPTRMCRGKNPINVPNLRAPRRKNVNPGGRVKRRLHQCKADQRMLTSDDRRKCKGDHSSRYDSAGVIFPYVIRDAVGNEMEEGLQGSHASAWKERSQVPPPTHHHLDHHAPISARKPTGARSVDELGYYRP